MQKNRFWLLLIPFSAWLGVVISTRIETVNLIFIVGYLILWALFIICCLIQDNQRSWENTKKGGEQ